MWQDNFRDPVGPYSILEFPPYQVFGFLVLLGLAFVGWVIGLAVEVGPVGAAKEVISLITSSF